MPMHEASRAVTAAVAGLLLAAFAPVAATGASPPSVTDRPSGSPPSSSERWQMPPAVAAIEASLIVLPRRERALAGVSAEGAQATAYLAEDQVIKVSVLALGERGRTHYESWWNGSRLLAARERVFDYGDIITALPVDKPVRLSLVADDRLVVAGGKRSLAALEPLGPREEASRAAEIEKAAQRFRSLMARP